MALTGGSSEDEFYLLINILRKFNTKIALSNQSVNQKLD